MRSTDRPVLITNAAASEEDQLSARKRRYVLLMGGRLALFLLAAMTYPVSAWLAVGLLAMSLPLPWMAVLIANDRLPRKQEAVNRYRPDAAGLEGHPQTAIGPGRSTEVVDGQVVDGPDADEPRVRPDAGQEGARRTG